MAASLKKIHVAKIAVDILRAVKASPRDHAATKENCFDFNRVSDLRLQFMKKITEIYRKAKKGTTCMLAETFPRIYCIEADICLPSNVQTFFYRRPQGYALDPSKIRTLRCSVHTEPPLKDPCEHSENIEQSRMNKVSDGRFVRCCVSMAQESESLEHSILPT